MATPARPTTCAIPKAAMVGAAKESDEPLSVAEAADSVAEPAASVADEAASERLLEISETVAEALLAAEVAASDARSEVPELVAEAEELPPQKSVANWVAAERQVSVE
jgi:hypothetical protein